ncbi:MAG: hypothetical protein KDC38_04440 [Planctomycetes bacterium]|nr:hypothetical protein [Planctomycetota bacterium]
MPLFNKKRVTIESQLAALAEIGLTLNPGVGEEQLTRSDDRRSLESPPYRGLIEVMGMDLEEEPYTPLCDRLWMCDVERVEDHGDYVEVLERLERMTSNALDLSHVKDHVDLEEGVAWLEFEHEGQRVRWDFRIDDDWLDPTVLTRYDGLLGASGSRVRIYSNHRDYGQVAFLAAFEPDQKKRFDQLSRIRLSRLPRG